MSIDLPVELCLMDLWQRQQQERGHRPLDRTSEVETQVAFCDLSRPEHQCLAFFFFKHKGPDTVLFKCPCITSPEHQQSSGHCCCRFLLKAGSPTGKQSTFLKTYIYLFGWAGSWLQHVGSSSLNKDKGRLTWEHRVLATRPPGKSPELFSSQCNKYFLSTYYVNIQFYTSTQTWTRSTDVCVCMHK